LTFDCCGSGLEDKNGTLVIYKNPNDEDKKWSDDNEVNFEEGSKCSNHSSLECLTCYTKIEEKVGKGFSTAGGLGLFFSFPEFIGLWLAARFRNQKDPRANPGAFF